MSSNSSTSSTSSSSSSSVPLPLPISIVGAGLTGSMAALLLGQFGERIRLVESRGDFRKAADQQAADNSSSLTGKLTNTTKRSINLALSHRGLSALKSAGSAIFDRLQPHLIPMRGRYIHSTKLDESPSFQPYGKGDQAIYSVSRNGLNAVLLDEVDRLSNVECLYDCKLTAIRSDGTTLETSRGEFPSKLVLGADGAFSRVRTCMSRFIRQSSNLSYIDHGYKELTIPPRVDEQTQIASYAFPDWQGLHIWPRGEFMLIALPNPDFSFTATLFAPFVGAGGLDSLVDSSSVLNYFRVYFPDVIPLVPDLVDEILSSPSSALVSVRCSPWNFESKILLLGDAAHATVPFFGQGMNAGFEDCLILKELYQFHNGDHTKYIEEFARLRTAAGFSLVDLSMENYVEMRSHTASTAFVLKKKLESAIHFCFPNYWIPKYSMVAFTRIPYDQAKQRAERQERILNNTFTGIKIAILLAAALGIFKLKSSGISKSSINFPQIFSYGRK